MKTIKQTLMSSAMILAVGLAFTSCEDILGEWDRPTPANVTPTDTSKPEQEPEQEPEATLTMLQTPLTFARQLVQAPT